MSTRTAFTVVGTVVGAYFGNAALGATIGSMVGGYVDPVKVKGPRLTDAQQQTSQDGVPIALTFGVVRIQGNIIASGPLVEHKSKDGGKGSGTETTNYTYTRTYAIGICEGPIGGIRRIWKNGKLAFDGRPRTGDETIQEIHERIQLGQFLNDHNLYYGNETQLPDGELQAALDADTVPAFRGLAYMVGVDEDVTATAGAIPTYEFEIVTSGDSRDDFEYVPTSYPAIMPWGLDTSSRRDPRYVAGKYKYQVQHTGNSTWFIDLNTAVQAAVSFWGKDPFVAIPNVMGWQNIASSSVLGMTGKLRPWTDASTALDQRDAENSPLTLVIPRRGFSGQTAYWAVGSGGDTWPCTNFAAHETWASYFTPNNPPSDQTLPGAQAYASGVLIYSAVNPGDDYDVSLKCGNSSTSDLYIYDDYLINAVPVPGCYQFIDPDWMLVPGTVDVYVDRYGGYHTQNDCIVEAGSFVQMAKLTFTSDGRAYTQAPVGPVLDVTSPSNTSDFWHDAYDQAVAMGEVPSGLVYPTDYPVSVDIACKCALGVSVYEGDVTLAEIVSALCFRAGLEPAEINVSELTERVIGFTVATQTNAADTINVLAPAFFFDGSEWDGVTHFIKRGHDHVEVLTFDDSVETDDPRIKETRAQDVELPATFVLSYFDPAADLAITTQRAARRAVTVSATGQDQLQIPVVMVSSQAAQVADMLMKDKWSALAGSLEQTIADEYSYLTPTDVVQVQSDGAVFRARLGQMTNQQGTLQYEATQDVQSAYTSDVEGLAPPAPDVGIDAPPGPTLALFFDLPALRDQDDQTGLYVAATGVSGPWAGALIEVSRDGGLTWSTVATVRQASTVGQLIEGLDAWNPYVVAEPQTFSVRLTSGTLESVTRAQLFNQANGAVVGSGELIQFQTAALLTAGQYELSGGTVRGRKNTPTPAHTTNENFALLSDLYFLPLERSDIGRTLTFRAVTLGTANVDGIVTTFAFTEANSVTEWPVTNVRASRDETTSNVSLAWSPRHRLGNARGPYASTFFTGFLVTISNGSSSRSYPTPAEAFTYTAAMQTSDFGGVVDPLTYTIAATNSITGAGDPATGTV